MRARRPRTRLLVGLAALAVVVTGLFTAAEHYRRRDYTAAFIRNKGILTTADVSLRQEQAAWRRYDVVLRNERGLEVSGILQVPAEGTAPTAALVILGGARTNKRAIEYIDGADDAVLLALDYPYDGRRSGLGAGEFVRALPGMRRALLDTPPAVMLAVDYLLLRPEVDPDRIVFIGGSLGALVGPAVAACDTRIDAAAFLFGAGDLRQLIAASVGGPAWTRPIVGYLGSLVTAPLEPTKYVGRISPRPVFMLSGRDDRRIPEACSRALHDAAGAPKTVRWIAADHVHIRSQRFHNLVRAELEAWLAQTGLRPRRQAR